MAPTPCPAFRQLPWDSSYQNSPRGLGRKIETTVHSVITSASVTPLVYPLIYTAFESSHGIIFNPVVDRFFQFGTMIHKDFRDTRRSPAWWVRYKTDLG
jgi:hypothetical protein